MSWQKSKKHVLKLFLYTENGKQEIAAYKRVWSVNQSGKDEASMDALLAYCARLPNAEDWQAETN